MTNDRYCILAIHAGIWLRFTMKPQKSYDVKRNKGARVTADSLRSKAADIIKLILPAVL